MFKINRKMLGIFIPLLSVFVLLGFSTPSQAAQFEDGDYTLESSEIVEENLYIGGSIVQIDGVVDGDLFIAAESITVTGTVTGDLYIAGNTLELSETANVYGSAYLAGQSISIRGDILKNLVVAGAISNMSGNIGKDMTVFSGTSTISGQVTEDVRVFSNKSTISDSVKGEIIVYAESSTIDEELVTGEIYENINSDTNTEDNTTGNLKNSMNKIWGSINILSLVLSFIGMYIVGVVLIFLAPVKTLQIEKKIIGSTKDFLLSLLIGLGILLLIPIPLIMLSLTVVGIPLALLVIAVLIFLCIFGRLWVESAIGQKILANKKQKDDKRLLSLLIGRGITTVMNIIPIIRGIYNTILSATAIGAIVRMKYDSFKEAKIKEEKK